MPSILKPAAWEAVVIIALPIDYHISTKFETDVPFWHGCLQDTTKVRRVRTSTLELITSSLHGNSFAPWIDIQEAVRVPNCLPVGCKCGQESDCDNCTCVVWG